MIGLQCHPDSRGGAVRGIRARIDRTPDGSLAVTYAIEGDIERLRVPPPGPPRFADRLWQHTCCEMFVARAGQSAYDEFNFSPSGEWAAYAFASYRKGVPLTGNVLDPGIKLRRAAGRIELDAFIPCRAGPLSVGLSAVIESDDGALSYWALKHPPGKPDFHHRDAFALELK